MLAALRVDSVAFGGLRVTVADAAALGALAAILLALARGKADTSALEANGGTGVLLLLLPGLVLFVLAVAAARLLAPCLRVLEWAARRATPSVRVALLSLARSPGEVLLTVVFFVLSVGIAVFAIAYRATLVQGEREQARYAVPGAVRPPGGSRRLVTVQEAARADALRRDAGRARLRLRQRHAAAATSRSSRCPRTRSRGSTAGARTSPRRRRPSSARCFVPRRRRACAASALAGHAPDAAVHDDRRPRRPHRDRREPARRLHAARLRRARAGRARADGRASRPRRAAAGSSRSALTFPLVASYRRRAPRGRDDARSVNDASTGTLRLAAAVHGLVRHERRARRRRRLPLRRQQRGRLDPPSARAARGRARSRRRVAGDRAGCRAERDRAAARRRTT